MLKVERALGRMNLNSTDITDYVCIGYHEMLDSTISSVCFSSDSAIESILENVSWRSECICKASGLKYNFILMNKADKSCISVGSTCFKYVLSTKNLSLIETYCSLSQLSNNSAHGISLASFKNNGSYYAKSLFWTKLGVCHKCSDKFKEILMSTSPGSKLQGLSIYQLCKFEVNQDGVLESKKKELSSYLFFLKKNNLHNSKKWKDWFIVANLMTKAVQQ